MPGALTIIAIVAFSPIFATARTVVRAYVGHDGEAHVVYRNTEKTVAPEPQQVGVEDIRVATDRQTVAWEVLTANCCTSYSIPFAIVVYKNRKKTVISPDGLMIHAWHFVGDGRRIAILFGPVHGNAARAKLYDCKTGRVLASWDTAGSAPDWARGWTAEQ